jgi:type I restriction enzyme M protein
MRSFHPPDDIHEIARALSPEPVTAIAELRKGNNSRIFQVDTRAGRYALKKYPATDNRNRLEAEVGALRFFERSGIGRTPRIVAVSPELRYALFSWIDGDPVDAVTDSDVAEFAAFQQKATKGFGDWRKATTPRLTGFNKDGQPKALIETIAEDLLAAFRQAPLLDAYDIYQHLMDYWAETMQDDAYLIAADGWVKGAQPREIFQAKNKENKLIWPEPHDYLKGKRRFKSDLVPAPILVARYFVAERDAIEALDSQLANLMQQLDEMREENSGEEGLLVEVIEGEGDKQRIAAKTVKARLTEIGKDPLFADERTALEAYADLLELQTEAKAKRKAAREDLDKKIDAKYPKLTEAEIKTLVVDDKWMARLSAAVKGELDRVSQTLTGRIRQLVERYAEPLPNLTEAVETLAARVNEHLRRMGASWS